MEFEKIYNTYFKDVYLYVLRLSGNEHIAEEITSDTFFKAMNSIDHFRGECDIRVWLCQIAKNCYYTHVKKNRRLESMEDHELQNILDFNAAVDEQIVHKETTAHIQSVLHTLPETYKEVFMWRIFADLSFKQIGQIFHKTDNWACVTYHRARAMLKKRLEESGYEK